MHSQENVQVFFLNKNSSYFYKKNYNERNLPTLSVKGISAKGMKSSLKEWMVPEFPFPLPHVTPFPH